MDDRVRLICPIRLQGADKGLSWFIVKLIIKAADEVWGKCSGSGGLQSEYTDSSSSQTVATASTGDRPRMKGGQALPRMVVLCQAKL